MINNISKLNNYLFKIYFINNSININHIDTWIYDIRMRIYVMKIRVRFPSKRFLQSWNIYDLYQ